MDNFSYCTPTRYVFGRGVESQTGDLAAAAGMSHVILVYGQGSAVRSGLLDRITASLDRSHVGYTLLGGVRPNPVDDMVYRGIDIARAVNADGIIAIGGGSAIDTAKAIAAGVPYEGDFWDFWSGKAVLADALPVGVVLTIPAAGSEGSGNSVITRTEGMIKISLRTDFALRPKFAVLNPEVTFTLPPYQTACGISDMMAHIMERYFTTTPDVEVTDRVAEGVLKAIIEEAPRVMADPADYEARANIMWCGTLAHNGVCGCGRVEDWSSHAVEHEISAVYDVAHGAGLAVVFPAWMTFVARRRPEKIAQFARRVFGIGDTCDREAASRGIASLKSFFKDVLGLPLTFSGLGISDPDIPLLVKRLHDNKGERIGNYMPLTSEDTAAIYGLML